VANVASLYGVMASLALLPATKPYFSMFKMTYFDIMIHVRFYLELKSAI